MISYCIAVYRPVYAHLLVHDLVRKTSAPYEILLWLNIKDPVDSWRFRAMVDLSRAYGADVRIVGDTPRNIGMRAYPKLFREAKYDMIVQIDDDVITVSREIAEKASAIFKKYPRIKQITANVWQDNYTNGARPGWDQYARVGQPGDGLLIGPVDGWFSIFHRDILDWPAFERDWEYYPLAAQVSTLCAANGRGSVLCDDMLVLHITGPEYASYYGMLDFEIEKYKRCKKPDIVWWYEDAKKRLPARGVLAESITKAVNYIDRFDP